MLPILRKKVALSSTQVIEPEPPADGVNITVQLSDATNASATIAPLKYNKQGWVIMDFDDSSLSALTLNNSLLKNTKYTDGAGNNIPYTAGVAVNGRFEFDKELVGGDIANARDSMTYAQLQGLINQGWDVMNHGYYHTYYNAPEAGFETPEKNFNALHELILDKINYEMNALVVPNNDSGYQTAAAAKGYVCGSSQGTFDNFSVWEQYQWPQRLSTLGDNWDYMAYKREFAVSGWYNGNEGWQRSNELINYLNNNPAERAIFGIGTHGMGDAEKANYAAWINDLHTRANDRIAFTSLREFWEYQYVKNKIQKTESIRGDNLNINLDYESIPNNRIRWHDLSFIISGGTIQNVTCNDSRFAISFNNNLINIRWITD